MYHFFVAPENIKKDNITITGSDVNHIKNVLRMKVGEKILISDGQGDDFLCELMSFEEDSILLNILSEEVERTELDTKFYLFQGLPKSEKMELIIQKTVELGVYEIIPVATKRSIVKLDEKKQETKLKRWQAIAESAAKQSKRAIIPEVKKVMSYDEAIEYSRSMDMVLIPYENFKDMKETKEILAEIKNGMKVGIFIGPEGGFDEKEVDKAIESDIKPISLGRRILRTETAGMAIISILMYLCED